MKKLALILSISFGIVSCHDDLDQVPTDPDSFTEENAVSYTHLTLPTKRIV